MFDELDKDGDGKENFWVCPWCGKMFLSPHDRRDHMKVCPQKPEDD